MKIPIWIKILATAWLFALAYGAQGASDPGLKLGIMPFNSALALMKTHQPLRQHLEQTLGVKVSIYTSADYYTFVNELLDGKFDIAIAGPHFARMAEDKGWTILQRYRIDLQPIIVVGANSHIKQLSDLKGKRIGLSSRLSMSSIGGVKWLADQGLVLGRDYELFERVTHGAAVAAVAVGDLDAALTTYTPLKQVPDDVQHNVKVMPIDVKVPHLMTLANKRLGAKRTNEINQALLSFGDSDNGKLFFSSTGYEGYKSVTASDLKSLKPYIELTVRLMRSE